MKYSLFSALLCLFVHTGWAQSAIWTSYNFTVKTGSDAAVLQLANDYFEEHPTADGVSAYLYENHFRDKNNDYSHSFIWAGTLEAMGDQYASDGGDAWQLFVTQLGQHIDNFHSAGMGNRVASINEKDTPSPIQMYFFLDVANAKKFKAAFDAYVPYRPKNHHVMMGGFNAGRSPDGESHWVVVGVNSFKEAMDLAGYRTGNAKAEKAWDTYIANNGGVEVVRTGLRILLGSW